jgi:uncharacterized protein YbjQ (UPF0145 family)
MIITTTDRIAEMRIVRTLGLVRGTTCRGRHLGKDLIAHRIAQVGGEIVEYTKMLSEAREQVLDRLEDEARELGANAIVGLRFATSEMMAGAAELMAYGTAVIVEPRDEEPDSESSPP